jgi:hypothetical protein
VGYQELSSAVRQRRIAIPRFARFALPWRTKIAVAGRDSIFPLSQNLGHLTSARCAGSESTKHSGTRPIELDCLASLAMAPPNTIRQFTTRELQRFELKHTRCGQVE